MNVCDRISTGRKVIAVAACVLIVLCLFAACGQKAEKDTSLQKVLDSGELILGLDIAFPPMGFVDDSGQIVGFDIDVAQEVCDRLGVTLVKKGSTGTRMKKN